MSVVGFDIGDFKACIAVARRNGVDVLLNKESKRETPTVVSFGSKERSLGVDGASQQSMNPKNTVFGLKRLLGKKFNEPSVQAELQYLPFKVVEGPDGKCLIEVMYLNENVQFSPERVMAMMLTDLKQNAEKEMGGTMMTDCVVSIPNYYTESERSAMIDAVDIAGLRCLRLIPDTTASALDFGIYKTDLSETEPLNVAFIDVGHSSLQVCIAAFTKGRLRVLSQTYDRHLGGRSFDNILFEHFCNEFKENYKLDVKSNARATLRLRSELTKMKKVLSANSLGSFALECFMNDIDVRGKLKREEFEAMSSDLLDAIIRPCQQAMEEAGLSLDQISSVELIGSASRIPSVSSKISEFFGQEISRTMNISECVSKGCALQCAMLSPVFRVREYEIQDISLHDINFSWEKDDKSVTTSTVFPKGNSVPSIKMLTFLRTESYSLQSAYASSDSSLPEGIEHQIGHYDVGPFKVPKGEEKAKLKVQVRLNLHGIVEVDSVQSIEEEEYEVEVIPTKEKTEGNGGKGAKAKQGDDEEMADASAAPEASQEENENGTDAKEEEEKPKEEPKPVKEMRKRTLKVDVPLRCKTLRLPAEELKVYVAKENEMRRIDVVQEQTKEARNALEAYILSMRNKLYDTLNEFVTEKDRSKFSKKLEEMEDWMYDEGEDESKDVYNKKMQQLKGIGDPIEERYSESNKRGPTIQQLTRTCQHYSALATSDDKKYAHITDDDRARVLKECQNAMDWLNDKVAMQDSTPKHVPPVLMSYDITKKREVIERVCEPIMSKPAPKPKKEEEKKEAESENKGDAKANGDAAPMQTDGAEAEQPEEATPMEASNDDVD
eukprot:CAMPEP_0198235372 /NCGR_PEP_ID=MMETSP1446-20131203/1275_1 /TAXON_ID=1461542 ORGANISM="Unidentified sp, Strain CCMP2111" /NCGR_SAMPLE_ID=MMETSP1446 /ASSEMBLY_ACC=CAM_ASM_001112 /LENGTH=834 /DNA_ID=CAMNT_0043916513 /DNA_START=82 /DNA_END=2589 /DNA_ORIENTATION=-